MGIEAADALNFVRIASLLSRNCINYYQAIFPFGQFRSTATDNTSDIKKKRQVKQYTLRVTSAKCFICIKINYWN